MKSILILTLVLLAGSAQAISDAAAYEMARKHVPKNQQTKVLSFYGKGNAKDVQMWYVMFFDPDAKSKARVVVIENGKVERFFPAEDSIVREEQLTFNPAPLKAGVAAVLKAADKYAAESRIPYDATRVYLNRPDKGQAPIWTVQLLKGEKTEGYIYIRPEKAEFVGYRPPEDGETTGGAPKKGFVKEVEETFIDVGADLEEFFTGERTVDKD